MNQGQLNRAIKKLELAQHLLYQQANDIQKQIDALKEEHKSLCPHTKFTVVRVVEYADDARIELPISVRHEKHCIKCGKVLGEVKL